MKERYMIVQIVKMLGYNITDDGGHGIFANCYEVVDKDYFTAESACAVKNKYSQPERYIVAKYWI